MSERDYQRETDLRLRMDQIEREYQASLDRLESAMDSTASPEEIRELCMSVTDLQQQYMTVSREFWRIARPDLVCREKIALAPGRCMALAMAGHKPQCSRSATYQLGDLIVCTQHFKMIEDPDEKRGQYDLYPDLWDSDGCGWAAHGVLNKFPKPFFWKRI